MLGFGLFCRIWVRIDPKGDKALKMRQGGGWTDVRMDRRTHIWTDGQIPPVFYRTLSPLGPLPKKPSQASNLPPQPSVHGLDGPLPCYPHSDSQS